MQNPPAAMPFIPNAKDHKGNEVCKVQILDYLVREVERKLTMVNENLARKKVKTWKLQKTRWWFVPVFSSSVQLKA